MNTMNGENLLAHFLRHGGRIGLLSAVPEPERQCLINMGEVDPAHCLCRVHIEREGYPLITIFGSSWKTDIEAGIWECLQSAILPALQRAQVNLPIPPRTEGDYNPTDSEIQNCEGGAK